MKNVAQYYEFPVEQRVRSSSERFQLAFGNKALDLLQRSEDYAAEASHKGLLLLGANEPVLELPVDRLRDAFGDSLEIESPQPRYIFDDPVRQPVMWLRVDTPCRYLDAVREDLQTRGATFHDDDCSRPPLCVIRAEAPLATLLGYPRQVSRLTAGAAQCCIWLSHYAPLETVHGPDAA